MATIRFRSDVPVRNKQLLIIGPTGTGSVTVDITCGIRTFSFNEWKPAEVVTTLRNSRAPEFALLSINVSGNDILISGPVDDDFIVSARYRPRVTITNTFGRNPVNQQTTISFSGAQAGTYTLTINGKTTGAITYGDLTDLLAKINALSGWTPGNAIIASADDNAVVIEFAGTLAASPVLVSIDPRNLRNDRVLFVEEVQQYHPAAHDVWLLAVGNSTVFTVTIDGVSTGNMRSDDPIDQIVSKIKGTSTKELNIYGGECISDYEGVRLMHFCLDFVGWDSTTRPTVVATEISGWDATEAALLYDPRPSGGGGDGFRGNLMIEYSELNTFTGVSSFLLDFTNTERGEIVLEYDGRTVQFEFIGGSDYASMKAACLALRAKLRDVSEFSEVWVDFTTAEWDFPSYSNPGAPNWIHPKFLYIVNANDSLKQIGGDARMHRLNWPGNAASPAIHKVFRRAGVNAGTFKLTFSEGTTAALAYNTSAATFETALDALIASGMVVAGTGTPNDPWLITYTTALGSRDLPIANSVEFGGNGTGNAQVGRAHVVPQTQSASISVATNAVGGTFNVSFGQEGPILINLGDSAATVDAALATLPTINDVANVVTTYDSTGGIYRIQFANALANRNLPALFLTANNLFVIEATAVRIIQRATGPRNFADPLNWSLGRMPAAGDDIIIDGDVADIIHGLRQWQQVVVDTTTDRFTASGGHDFVDGQIIGFKGASGSTLPAGVTEGTQYFVIDSNVVVGTFRLSATSGGPPINITTTGSGTVFAGMYANTVRIPSTFSAAIGRTERTDQDSVEYLNRYLKIGTEKVLEIGGGSGNGIRLGRFNVGVSSGDVRVLSTGSSSESDRPAVCVLAAANWVDIELINGELGVASFEGELSVVGVVSQNSGSITFGDVSALSLAALGGRRLARNLTVSGSISFQG